MRKTKIVATLGPASNDIETIKRLISAGMNAARINFSHGSYESHEQTVSTLKQAREEMHAPIPLILDTKGPEIRIKSFDTEQVDLKQGNTFTLTTTDIVGDESRVAITYADLPKDVKAGSRILIDDGLVELTVTGISGPDIVCMVENNGTLSANKGVNVPDAYVNLPSLTEKDVEDIKFGIRQGFEYIAASFIRNANDVLEIRNVLEENGGNDIMIIAKIESRDGVNNIDAILELADGIMVARGDLGVEIPAEEVPLVQKTLIRKANEKGKPVITATQMLESMITNPRPTRAEANDVANAIYDGSDAIMLSGETAKGAYPVEAVKMMSRIAEATESSIDYDEKLFATNTGEAFRTTITNALSFAACVTALDLRSACIVTVTDSGFTTKMVSRCRPSCPILAVTQVRTIWRQLNLTWGCVSALAQEIKGDSEVFETALEMAVAQGLARDGDSIAIVAGVPIGTAGTTNTLKVQIVGNVITKGQGYGSRVVSGNANVIKVLEEAEKYFRPGEILVTTKTSNDLMPYIKRASAIVVGSYEPLDHAHAITVAAALDKPLIIANQKVVDLITDGYAITVDTKQGFVYNGIRSSI